MTVKLTRKQEEALQIIDQKVPKSSAVNRHIKGWEAEELKTLNDLSLDEFIKCLYMEDCEVEPKYEVGDYIFSRTWEDIGKVTSINETTVTAERFQDESKYIRHAYEHEIQHEKERRFWDRHGRDVWELREGDLIKDNDSHDLKEVQKVKGRITVVGGFSGYDRIDFIKEYYHVVCFAENRLDVSHDDQ